jgi:hypothetical protein
MARVDAEDIELALTDAELVTCLQAPIGEAKQLRDECLAADIPVLLDRGACCGSGGCGCAPKLELRARPEDLPRVTRLLQERWRQMMLREGTLSPDDLIVPIMPIAAPPEAEGGDSPCPGCGTIAPLVGGACSDCGLQLA